MPIALENTARTSKTFNLTHRIAPIRAVHKRAVTDREGKTRIHDHRVVYPESITLLAGETKHGLPDSYANAPEVAKAIAKGVLKKTEEAAKAPAVASERVDDAAPGITDKEAPAPAKARRARGGEEG